MSESICNTCSGTGYVEVCNGNTCEQRTCYDCGGSGISK